MRRITTTILLLTTVVLSAFTTFQSMDWQIADGYAIKFKGTEAEGIFNEVKGAISFDENNLSSAKMDISIGVASINTGNGMKNKHAKSDKWFDAEQYPVIAFHSSKITKVGTAYKVEGMLEMHGVKKQIEIPFTFGANVFSGKFSLNRLDYGVGTMEGMSEKVSNSIELEITVPVTKK
jgi:polyisoprenoid-binding protein YceI